MRRSNPSRSAPSTRCTLPSLNKRFNKRFSRRPDYVRLAASTEHVVTPVQDRQAASGDDPATLLRRAPLSISTFKTEWNWSDIDEPSFERLLTNHGNWSSRAAPTGYGSC
jgi:hypothetical protein